jgi:glycosyltransferase involved in cell wall biosynthesis
MALGVPVVAARVPGADEQLGDAALMVNPGDPAEIADAIDRVRSDQALRQELARRGTARAHAFTSQDFVKGVLRVLDDLEPAFECWSEPPA